MNSQPSGHLNYAFCCCCENFMLKQATPSRVHPGWVGVLFSFLISVRVSSCLTCCSVQPQSSRSNRNAPALIPHHRAILLSPSFSVYSGAVLEGMLSFSVSFTPCHSSSVLWFKTVSSGVACVCLHVYVHLHGNDLKLSQNKYTVVIITSLT